MKLIGSYKLNVKKEIVWQALNNPDILKQCIPGCESFVKESSAVFSASATNQIGPMNATFSGKVSLSNIKENESYTLSAEGQSSVGFANGSANVTPAAATKSVVGPNIGHVTSLNCSQVDWAPSISAA